MTGISWLRERLRFDRNEFAGSFGDIGTDLPLILAMIPAAGLDAAGVFVMFGILQILSGVAYGLPMPMQPLKAMAVLVITQHLNGNILFGGGLAIGAVMLVLSLSGALGWLARVIPLCVVRGIQFGLGLSLASLATKEYIPSMGASGWVLACISFVVILVFMGNRRFPAALPVVGLGIAYAVLAGPAAMITDSLPGFSLSLPRLHVPTWQDIGTGLFVLALPQLPLSLSNSVIATERTIRDLFPKRSVSARTIGFSYAIANIAAPFFGGIPVCHGCGGLAGHHAFGARTGGSVVIYGAVFALLGLCFGGAALGLARAFPQPVLGVILLFEALVLILFIREVAASRREALIAVLVGVIAWGLPQGYVIGSVVGTFVFYASRHISALRESA